MYKEVNVTKEVTETHKYCDVCDAEIPRGLTCSVARCECCKKDLCDKCVGHEDCSYGDYRTVYCERCWKIGFGHRKTIEFLEEQTDRFYRKWRAECNCDNEKKGGS